MRLYLLRHGPALSRESWDGPDDLRPLSREGEEVTRAVATRIGGLGLHLAAVLTSPYERALRTAVLVHERIGDEVELVQDDRLTPARFDTPALGEILGERRDCPALMLVGHEPSMSIVLADIVGGGRFSFKKCGLARVDLDPDSPQGGVLRWFVPPRLLG